MKRRLHEPDIFEDQSSAYFKYANNTLALATIISILAIVLGTVESFSQYHRWFSVIEYVTTALFTFEYVYRLKMSPRPLRYALSFFGIIDLLAIIPTYLGVANMTFLKSTRALRILRLLRMVRLAKLGKHGTSLHHTESIYGLNVEIYVLTLVFSLLLLGSGLYVVEGHATYAKDIPSGMYWAFKVILGGIPYEQPTTTLGTFVIISARLVNLILLGLLLNLMGTVMRKILIGSEEEK